METGKFFQGHLLVASPQLMDPNFHRTVVLIVQHSEEGALGVVLNRPSETAIHEIWAKVADTPCNSEQNLYLGGPVEGPLMAVHTHQAHSEIEIVPGIYFSVQKDNLNRIVACEDNSFKLFIGHSGWAAGQLEAELEEGAWLTTPANVQHVFQADEDEWERVLREIRGSAILSRLKVKHVPPDPRMN